MGGGFPGAGGMGGFPAGGMGGGFPGAGGGMPAGAMGLMSQLMSDPEIAEGMKNPKIMAAMTKLMSNPAGAMSLMSDPEVAPFMKKIMAKMGPLFGGMGGAGAGAGGAAHGNFGEDDDYDDMPDLEMPDAH